MLLIDITLTRFTSTEMAKLPSNQIGRSGAEVKKTEWKIRRHVFVLNKTLNLVISLWFFSEDGNEV